MSDETTRQTEGGAEMDERRLILFVELVRGCNNTACPSHGTVCQYDGLNFMSPDTLRRLAADTRSALQAAEFKYVRTDVWMYGCGDSLEHPDLAGMLRLARETMRDIGPLSVAIDSHCDIPAGDRYESLDKLKIIHKKPETFDWVERAELWETLGVAMSHKLITDTLTLADWGRWKDSRVIREMKAVPWHDIPLATDAPVFTPRAKFAVEPGVPVEYAERAGTPVHRAMLAWDGSFRRCLVCGTEQTEMKSLLFEGDEICKICFPATGAQLAKFHEDRIVITPASSCVSDGYASC